VVKLVAIFSEFRKVRVLTESGRSGMLSSGRSQRTTGNNVDLRSTDSHTIFGFWCLAAPPEGCMSDRPDPSGPPTVRPDPSPGRPHVVSGRPAGQDPRGFRSEGLQWVYLFCLNLSPPPPLARFIKLAKVEPGPAKAWWVLSPRYLGYVVHFHENRYHACTQEIGACHFCKQMLPSRWLGFLAVLTPVYRAPRLLPLTQGAVQNCEEIQKLDGGLRGLLIVASRLGHKPNSPLHVELRRPGPDEVFPADAPNPDVASAVARLLLCDKIASATQDTGPEPIMTAHVEDRVDETFANASERWRSHRSNRGSHQAEGA
jgi:hypothetical protein